MRVKMKPVCDCGYVFDQLTVGQSVYIDPPYRTARYIISPYKCPKCGEYIDSVIMQGLVDGHFDYDVKKYELEG